MTPFTPLRSRDNPRIRAALRLRRQRARRQQGRFIADGVRQVERAVAAGLTLHEAFICPVMVRPDEAAVVQRLTETTPVDRWFDLSPTLMERVAYRQGPQSLVAVFEQPRWAGTATSLDDAAVPGPALWLVAVGIAKPGNLGAMVRTADAAGACGVWVADGVVDPFHPNAIEASTGAVFELPIHAAASADVLAALVAQQARVVAGVPDAPTPYTSVDMTGPLALVIGAEDRGLAAPWVASHGGADPTGPTIEAVSIGTRGRVADSLNAAASAAVLLFEAVRQRAKSSDTI